MALKRAVSSRKSLNEGLRIRCSTLSELCSGATLKRPDTWCLMTFPSIPGLWRRSLYCLCDAWRDRTGYRNPQNSVSPECLYALGYIGLKDANGWCLSFYTRSGVGRTDVCIAHKYDDLFP